MVLFSCPVKLNTFARAEMRANNVITHISMKQTVLCALALFICTVSLPAIADALNVTTPRGQKVEVVVDFPSGPGPFPAVVLAPGQGYPMTLPALAQTARRLVDQGVAVYRFNWAYFTRTPKGGGPSDDLSHELEDLSAVLAVARAEPRVDRTRLSVGGKSLGSIIAWRAFSADKSLRSGLFLTPVCSRAAKGQSTPIPVAEENYPGIAVERRPISFILGDRDPLCAPSVLYRFAANAAGPARVAVIGGDHNYENRTVKGAAADQARDRNIDAVAQLAAIFIVDASAD